MYCASIENHLVSQGLGAKYLVGENMTLADIAVGSNFMKLVFNDANTNQEKFGKVLERYPRTK